VVRDPATHRAVLEGVVGEALGRGWQLLGLTLSPLKGPAGNIEFLAWLGKDTGLEPAEPDGAIRAALARTE
jgi:23S rRNA (cytidine1920-2'-O)/16S rRNA (cytidine1409-2'-O)-methyltransferase